MELLVLASYGTLQPFTKPYNFLGNSLIPSPYLVWALAGWLGSGFTLLLHWSYPNTLITFFNCIILT